MRCCINHVSQGPPGAGFIFVLATGHRQARVQVAWTSRCELSGGDLHDMSWTNENAQPARWRVV
jgi:hypothetical protein